MQPESTASSQEYAAEDRARTESRLGFRVGGKLIKRSADVGDSVRDGQALAQLDSRDLQLGYEAAQAALRSTQANLDLARADYARFKELRDQGFISGSELERREGTLKAARAQHEQARAQSSVQGNQAAYALLVAKVSGVITGVDAEPGAVVAAGAPIVRLAHDGDRDVVFSVPEDRVGAVRTVLGKPGALKIKLWGDGATPLTGSVREIGASADPVTRTLTVKADIGRTAVRLGQTAGVRVERSAGAGAIQLPLTALLEDQGKTSVWLLDPATMTVSPQPVQVGGAQDNSVVVAAVLAMIPLSRSVF